MKIRHHMDAIPLTNVILDILDDMPKLDTYECDVYHTGFSDMLSFSRRFSVKFTITVNDIITINRRIDNKNVAKLDYIDPNFIEQLISVINKI